MKHDETWKLILPNISHLIEEKKQRTMYLLTILEIIEGNAVFFYKWLELLKNKRKYYYLSPMIIDYSSWNMINIIILSISKMIL